MLNFKDKRKIQALALFSILFSLPSCWDSKHQRQINDYIVTIERNIEIYGNFYSREDLRDYQSSINIDKISGNVVYWKDNGKHYYLFNLGDLDHDQVELDIQSDKEIITLKCKYLWGDCIEIENSDTRELIEKKGWITIILKSNGLETRDTLKLVIREFD